MIDFSFQNPTKILFGRTALSHLGEETVKYGKRVLMVYGSGSIKKSGLYQKIMDELRGIGAEVTELNGILPNPRLKPVYEGVRLCHEHKIELVLGVGGGSAIDTAKAIANAACYDGDAWDLFCGLGTNQQVLPIGTIGTLPAAGSEMSCSCVITREEDSCKRGLNIPFNFPKFSILNPEFTFSLPPYQTACGCVDIMSHMMERYFTQIEHVELIDRMIEGALKTVLNNAPIVMVKPDDYDARAEIMWASCLAHNTLLQTGRVGDWASHKLEHELSAIYDIAHGGGLAIITPAWMKYVLPRGGAKKLAQFAERVFDIIRNGQTDEEIALEGIGRLEAFYQSLNLPIHLRAIGIDESNIALMSERSVRMAGGSVGHFVKLDVNDAMAIYKMAL